MISLVNPRCISVGTRQGYRIYNCQPFGECFHQTEGGIGLINMLYCSSLIALVGAGDQPAFSPRRLRLWNTQKREAICDLNFITAILSLQLNRERLVVVLERKIYICDLNSMEILETLDTCANPKGLCVLSSGPPAPAAASSVSPRLASDSGHRSRYK